MRIFTYLILFTSYQPLEIYPQKKSCHPLENQPQIYFKVLAYRRKALNIASACEFDESLNNEIISPIPFGGIPVFFLVIKLCKDPAQAPRFPSQYSGDGSIFSSMSKAFAAIQNSPIR